MMMIPTPGERNMTKREVKQVALRIQEALAELDGKTRDAGTGFLVRMMSRAAAILATGQRPKLPEGLLNQ